MYSHIFFDFMALGSSIEHEWPLADVSMQAHLAQCQMASARLCGFSALT